MEKEDLVKKKLIIKMINNFKSLVKEIENNNDFYKLNSSFKYYYQIYDHCNHLLEKLNIKYNEDISKIIICKYEIIDFKINENKDLKIYFYENKELKYTYIFNRFYIKIINNILVMKKKKIFKDDKSSIYSIICLNMSNELKNRFKFELVI